MIGIARAVRVAALAAVALLTLAACASGTGGGDASPSPTPEPTASAEPPIAAAWLDEGRALGVVTYGSSSCPPAAVGTEFHIGTLAVDLADPGEGPCTADYAPRATFVGAPEVIDPHTSLMVQVIGDYTGQVLIAGDIDLTGVPREPTDYAPSAGWADQGMLVILTWGSSSCPPVIEGVEATGPSEVTVTFATPPADQVCTMDMAPRTTLAVFEPPEDALGATLVLTGGEFDGVQVRIAGMP